MADEGYKTVVVSTDPAHSLGDALQMDLKGGGLIPVRVMNVHSILKKISSVICGCAKEPTTLRAAKENLKQRSGP